jgi:putative FmdB family regulatory protein
MPIYEYEAAKPDAGCGRCRRSFEVMQSMRDEPLEACPSCGGAVKRCISLVRVVIPGAAAGQDSVEREVADYERQGMWSHAAELADKVSEKPERAHLKERAMENYKRAGYDV